MLRARVFPIMLPLLALAACYSPSTQAPEVSDDELEREEAIQSRMVAQAAEKGGIPRTWRGRSNVKKQFEEVATRIEDAGAGLCQEMGLPKLDRRCYFYFHYASTDRDINAYASGDEIIIARGMMRFIENDDELAGVMGHEYAHNVMGHIDASLDNQVTGNMIGLVLDSVTGNYAAFDSVNASREGAVIGALSYSESFEAEADYVGLYVLARAGYDITRMPNFWRRMSVENPDGVYNGGTHPTHPERFVALQKTVAEIEEKRRNKEPLIPNMKHQPMEGEYKAQHWYEKKWYKW